MFDATQRALTGMHSFTLSIPMPTDDAGYLDRCCPQEECGGAYKVLVADWQRLIQPNATEYCAFCRHQADPSAFFSAEQMNYIQEYGKAEIMRRLGQALQHDADRFNRQQPRGGFLSLSLDVRLPPLPATIAPAVREIMTLCLTCEQCGCQSAVIGAAYFCPACGYNSASHTVAQTLTIARTAIQYLPSIRAALPDPDAAAQAAKVLIEGAFCSLVTAFQRFAEAEYPRLPHPTLAPRRNAFQNLDEGSRLWAGAGGHDYATLIATGDLLALRRYFQQRHLLQHREGMVDQAYCDQTRDPTYVVGQRVSISERQILHAIDVIEHLITGMRHDIP